MGMGDALGGALGAGGGLGQGIGALAGQQQGVRPGQIVYFEDTPDPLERYTRIQEAAMRARNYDDCRQRGLDPDPHRWALTSTSYGVREPPVHKKKNLSIREELQEEIDEWLDDF